MSSLAPNSTAAAAVANVSAQASASAAVSFFNVRPFSFSEQHAVPQPYYRPFDGRGECPLTHSRDCWVLGRSDDRVEQPIGAEAHRIVGDETVSASAAAIAARAASSSSSRRVFSATAATFAFRAGSEIRSCRSTSSGSGSSGWPGIALDLGLAGHVAEDEQVRRRAVDQPERDAGVRGMDHRSLPLDEQQLAAALVPFDDQPLGGAGEEVGDDRIDGDPPPRDRDPRLAGRHEARLDPARRAPPVRARARRSSSRSRSPSRP